MRPLSSLPRTLSFFTPVFRSDRRASFRTNRRSSFPRPPDPWIRSQDDLDALSVGDVQRTTERVAQRRLRLPEAIHVRRAHVQLQEAEVLQLIEAREDVGMNERVDCGLGRARARNGGAQIFRKPPGPRAVEVEDGADDVLREESEVYDLDEAGILGNVEIGQRSCPFDLGKVVAADVRKTHLAVGAGLIDPGEHDGTIIAIGRHQSCRIRHRVEPVEHVARGKRLGFAALLQAVVDAIEVDRALGRACPDTARALRHRSAPLMSPRILSYADGSPGREHWASYTLRDTFISRELSELRSAHGVARRQPRLALRPL